ncbi:MAG: gliding motility-associated C-terminal domain-containing protein, partial [Bacteroidales bacterium]|nr:gliding motility-associated C-terminal domain-containing protein [Bacteroidales bacterium]
MEIKKLRRYSFTPYVSHISRCISYAFLFLFFFLGSYHSAQATHNRAGEITYKHLYGYTYQITLITYTYTLSAANESRTYLPIEWGDGSIDVIPRISHEFLPDDYTRNVYQKNHTYPGAGIYTLLMEDPNRNEGIVNIFESVNIPFSISTILRIDPILGNNSTPILLYPPVDKAALGQKFIHNPAAFDPDGDSLSYKLTVCTGQNGEAIPNYHYPKANKDFYVNAVSGDLVWDAPQELGAYNVAMLVEEWRNGVVIGSVERDIQIEVYETQNNAPSIEAIQHICVHAGDTVQFTVTARDIDNDNITLSAIGGPLDIMTNKAEFTPVSNKGEVQATFFWVPTSEEIRTQPYIVVCKASDSNAEVPLVALHYVSISVIGHPPTELQSTVLDRAISLSWNDSITKKASSYSIYRSRTPINYTPGDCEFGLPAALATDYELVETIQTPVQLYNDTNHGFGLSPGFTYCYRILAHYTDNTPSYISQEICTSLTPVFPVITNVSVKQTHETGGAIYIAWTKPKGFDSLSYPKPYSYKLYRSQEFDTQNKQLIATISDWNDTTYTDKNLNTLNSPYSYSVDFVSHTNGKEILIGSSTVCSSPFIQLTAENKKITITYNANTAWKNDSVYVFRRVINTEKFDSLGIFTNNNFIDNNVFNHVQYLYYIQTSGYFSHPKLPDRVYNFSQIASIMPLDTIPPKTPKFQVTHNCKTLSRTIEWDSHYNDDIEFVHIYFKDCRTENFQKITTVPAQFSEYTQSFIDSTQNMAGCYYISFSDSTGNESSHIFDTCLYNCPEYALPNVFTPNNDDENEIYHPVQNRFVHHIDMKIYDSWGQLVFSTNNPE